MKVFLAIFLLFAILLGCRQVDSTCRVNFEDLLTIDSNNVIKTVNQNGTFQIFDKIKDTFPMGIYEFDSEGNLLAYKFLTSPKTFIYAENYGNSQTVSETIGSPLVNQTLVYGKDSICIILSFFALNKEYNEVFFVNNSNDSFIVPLSNSGVYTNMMCARLMLKRSGSDSLKRGVIKVNYKNTCSGFAYSFEDVILF